MLLTKDMIALAAVRLSPGSTTLAECRGACALGRFSGGVVLSVEMRIAAIAGSSPAACGFGPWVVSR